MMKRMLFAAALALAACATSSAQPISAQQCGRIEPALGDVRNSILGFTQKSEQLVATMNRVEPLLTSRPDLGRAFLSFRAETEAAAAANRRQVQALEDFQHQLRLCIRG